MNPRLMYGFLAGLLLAFVGYSLLQSGTDGGRLPSILGFIFLFVGGVLLVGSLFLQAKRRRDEDRNA